MHIAQTIESSLNALIASEATLYFNTKKAHWLADGRAFVALHEMLDDQASMVIDAIDKMAERIVMLRGMPAAGLSELQRETLVKDAPAGKQEVATALELLSQEHERISDEMRKTVSAAIEADDPGTADVLTRILQKHDKAAWYLRASLVSEGREEARPKKQQTQPAPGRATAD